MADYIDREELRKALKKEFRQNDYIKHDLYFGFKNILENQPSVDVVKVVRCKDCKYCEERQMANGLSFDYCKKVKSSVLEHFYCIWGEKE